MGDVLSQSEIDNLLAALSSGELDASDIKDSNEKIVKTYDFNRPSKFSKEHLRTLEIIFEHYGRLLSTSLPAYLRKNVQVEVVNAEATIYQEFTNSLSNPVLLGIVDFSPLTGNIIIEMAEKLGYGDEAELIAIPNHGYYFVGWSDGVNDNPRHIIVNDDASYFAIFESFETE